MQNFNDPLQKIMLLFGDNLFTRTKHLEKHVKQSTKEEEIVESAA